MRRALAALLLLLTGQAEEPVAVSRAPDAVSVTVYRRPYGPAASFDLHWLEGYALVTETRRISVPAGRATIRFEGVAGGIVPASAIVTGLPGGVIEKNRDARLLSPAALIAGYLGRRVSVTRTDKASGKAVTQPAIIVAGPAGGVVLRTPDGVEALGCSGLAEHPAYPAVPAGLSASPVLSVETDSPRAATATVTLSYLASEFDWTASYVATVTPDGGHLDLFAWLTLANGNAESFPAAQVQAVAGRLNHTQARFREFAPPLDLHCYPLGTTTSDLRLRQPIARLRKASDDGDIVVTGMRFAVAAPPPPPPPPPAPPPPEDLGDVKLYRVPEPVTVAANAQKQVALLARSRVPFRRVFRRTVTPGEAITAAPTQVALRLANTAATGLGIPLPAGATALYSPGHLLVGTGALTDKAIGEALRIDAGWSRQVTVAQEGDRTSGHVTVSNADPVPATVEIALPGWMRGTSGGHALPIVEAQSTWTVTVPANGHATLNYVVTR